MPEPLRMPRSASGRARPTGNTQPLLLRAHAWRRADTEGVEGEEQHLLWGAHACKQRRPALDTAGTGTCDSRRSSGRVLLVLSSATGNERLRSPAATGCRTKVRRYPPQHERRQHATIHSPCLCLPFFCRAEPYGTLLKLEGGCRLTSLPPGCGRTASQSSYRPWCL